MCKATLPSQAEKFAQKSHQGLFRHDKKTPYIVHPIRVARLLADEKQSEALVAAAYLHDTLEDTSTTYAELEIGRASCRERAYVLV